MTLAICYGFILKSKEFKSESYVAQAGFKLHL